MKESKGHAVGPRRLLLWQTILPAIGCAALVLAASFLVFIPTFEQNLIVQKREMIRQETQIAWSILDGFYRLEREGAMSRERAQRMAASEIRGLRFGAESKDYFWVNDMDHNLVVHPYRADLEGTNVADFVDPAGKKLFVEFVSIVRARKEGYVEYIWQWKDDADRLVAKQSFVKGFEPWGWVVGTGVYLEDVHQETARVTHRLVLTSLLVLMLILVLSSYLAFLAARGERRRLVSHRKQLQSERRLANAVDFLPDATFVVDAERRVLAWNRAMEELSGIAAKEMLGKSDNSYAVPLYGEQRPLLIDLVFEFNEDLASKYDFIQKDSKGISAESFAPSTGRHFVASAGPLRDGDGNLVGAIESVRDISHLKAAERERERLREQLNRSQRLESIGKLAGGIAHDFNNLLVPILGYTELLGFSQALDEQQRKLLDNIASAGAKARDLTRQLLAFSRRQPMERKSLSLNDVIRGFEGVARGAIREDIELSFRLTPSLGFIQGDASQLEQVLMNLVVNGQDAMPQGGRLSIETSDVELDAAFCAEHLAVRPGRYVRLTVGDTGIGMAASVVAKIFEPFFTTKEKGRGTGLGLSTVYGIVKQHEGHIWVYSEPGLGTAFKVYLPLRADASSPDVASPRSTPDVGGGECILVVEDDPMVRELVATFLTSHGYRVIAASKPEEVVRRVEDEGLAFDLLLSDVIMPKMNGPQLYEKLAKARPGLSVLYMSGYTRDIMEHHGILDADPRLIHKPFSLGVLSDKVRVALGRGAHARTAADAEPRLARSV